MHFQTVQLLYYRLWHWSLHSLLDKKYVNAHMPVPMKHLWHTTSLLQVSSSLHSKFTTLYPWSPLLGLHVKLVRSGPVSGYWPLLLLLHLGFDFCLLSCVAHGKTSSWKLSLSKKVCNFLFTLIFANCYFSVTFSDSDIHIATTSY